MVELFSKRQKRLRGEAPDVYSYDELPKELRIQTIKAWDKVFESLAWKSFSNGCIKARPLDFFGKIREVLTEEYGCFILAKDARNAEDEITEFFLDTANVEKCLDVIELLFASLREMGRSELWRNQLMPGIEEAISTVNARFKEHAIGYEFRDGKIFRIDCEFLHSEVVVPALTLLQGPEYQGANAEFRSAHEHYRAKRYKECINDCLKAFESTMKAICSKRGWPHAPTATAKPLVAVCRDNGLFPVFMESHLNALITCLESGVPTARNKTSGHGQGTSPTKVEPEFASYVLHLTAANIVFLASCA